MTLRDIVIPAGGTIDDKFAKLIGVSWRALAPFGPERVPVLQLVVNALRGSGCVRRIACVAPPGLSERIDGVDIWLPAFPEGAENIVRGLYTFSYDDVPVLICTSDLPLMTPADVADFCGRCDDARDITLGLVRADDYNQAFQNAPPSTFVRLGDAGAVTLSGLFLVRPSLLLNHRALLFQAFEARKNQWGLVRLLGPRLVGQFLARRLTLASLQARAESLLGCHAQILLSVAPALACDMDTADDYTYAHQVYTARLVS